MHRAVAGGVSAMATRHLHALVWYVISVILHTSNVSFELTSSVLLPLFTASTTFRLL
jgi:hypothetical protein